MVSAPPAPPPFRVSQRLRYRELLGLVAIQSFGNQMAGSFWIVYLVSEPQALAFDVAALLWVVAYLTAAVVVVVMSRGRPIHARSSMTLALMIMAFCHFAFAVLPASWIVVVGGLAFGLYLPLFWLPMNCLLVRETSPANRAGRLAAVTATFTTVAIAAPILGGFVANVVGYPVVFGLGGVIVASNLLLIRRRVAPSESFAFSIDLRRTAPRTTLAFSGPGGVDGLLSAVAPSFIFTILVDRTEDSIPTVTATRELLLNTSRTLALVAGLVVLALGGDVYALYVLVGGVILLEALAK